MRDTRERERDGGERWDDNYEIIMHTISCKNLLRVRKLSFGGENV